jgi:two-component system, NtrC family, sensor kinase
MPMPPDVDSDQSPARAAATIGPAELLEINRLRIAARMVSSAVHDVGNALQIVSGSAELLSTRSELGPSDQRRLQAISAKTERISTTLGRLTAFALPGAAGRQTTDIGELVELAVAMCGFALNRARVETTVESAVAVPFLASVDRCRVLQLFLNLLLNAEAALAGWPNATLRILLEPSGRGCNISFTDNGPGLNVEGRARLASAAPTPAIEPGLSGIGLWACARIAGQHGGKFVIADAAGPGASLVLWLPGV